MTAAHSLAVTGSTGALGGLVARLLADTGVPQRLLVRGDDDVIRGPGGTGRCAFVSRADVARTAAVILQDPGSHLGCRYDLTGPEALSFAEAAQQLSAARGRTITYHDESVEEAYGSRRKWLLRFYWQYDAWVSTYSAIASGDLAEVSSAVLDITGTAPITLAQHLATANPSA